MASRWEVEKAVKQSNLDPPGRLIMLTLLTATTARDATVPAAHVPTYTEMERETGLSRSALVEWMRTLVDGGWVERVPVPEESRPALRLTPGNPDAARAARKASTKPAKDVDGAYRQAARQPEEAVSPGDTNRTAERYDAVPLSDTPDDPHCLIENSPTESSTTTTYLEPSEPADRTPPKKRTRKPKNVDESPREDVEKICNYLAEWIVKNGSKRPTINKTWRNEARLLIDHDKRPIEEIREVIRWCQKDRFWKANVLSMATLREKYDRFRMRAEQERDNPSAQQGRRNGNLTSGHQPYRDPRRDHTEDELRDMYSGRI